jgi:hypothetical protein
MPDLANDAMRRVRRHQNRPRAGRSEAAWFPGLRRWAGAVAAGGLLSLAGCGGSSIEAGPTGGVIKRSDALTAQQDALEHCRKYGKSGRVTGPIGDEQYSFVCE